MLERKGRVLVMKIRDKKLFLCSEIYCHISPELCVIEVNEIERKI